MIWGQITFEEAASPIISALTSFHDQAIIAITLITWYVLYVLTNTISHNISVNLPHENHNLEIVWTLTPAIILVLLALPSLRILYLLDEITTPEITIKATGHQWYWSYDYANFTSIEFDSYIVQSPRLNIGEFRLLEVDNRLVLPWGVETRILITAADVLHSWTIPSMGVKADAVPGRLNQVTLFPTRPGVFYGQCSEICGANHSFMPIAIETIKLPAWSNWLATNINQ